MSNPFSFARLAAFTISLLLLTQAIEPGWGIDPAWGWYLALAVLTTFAIFDLASFVTNILAWALLLGIMEPSHAAFIALTLFTGVSILKRVLFRSRRRSRFSWYSTSRQFDAPSTGEGWRGSSW